MITVHLLCRARTGVRPCDPETRHRYGAVEARLLLALICVFCASQAQAAIAHVQTKGQQFGSVSSASLTFDGSTTSGNLIVVCITSYKSGKAATYTVSDNKGNAYSEAGSITDGTNFSVHIFFAKNITGGVAHQVTITPDATAVPSLSISEFSGADTANPLDREIGTTGSGTSANSGNITTTAAALVIGVVTHNGATMALTPGGSYIQAFENESASGTMPINSEYKIVAVGTYSGDWTLASNTAWDAVVASFKAAAGGGGGGGNEIITYYHTDAIGSVRMITDSNAQVVERHDYLPFGEEWTTASSEHRLFVSKERDQETGLDYSGARYYAPGSGRFVSPDPISANDVRLIIPQRWNRYTYAANNPLTYSDPDGLDVIVFNFVNGADGYGHVGIMAVDSSNGSALYGGFNPAHKSWFSQFHDKQGAVTPVPFPAGSIQYDNGRPTKESLAKVAAQVAQQEGQGAGGPIRAAFFKTTEAQTQSLRNFITRIQQNPPAYDLMGYNCQVFCILGLRAASIDAPAPSQLLQARPNVYFALTLSELSWRLAASQQPRVTTTYCFNSEKGCAP